MVRAIMHLTRHLLTRRQKREISRLLKMPEQKQVEIKKNGNVVKTINVRQKATYFNDRWARTFWTIFFVLNIVIFNVLILRNVIFLTSKSLSDLFCSKFNNDNAWKWKYIHMTNMCEINSRREILIKFSFFIIENYENKNTKRIVKF